MTLLALRVVAYATLSRYAQLERILLTCKTKKPT